MKLEEALALIDSTEFNPGKALTTAMSGDDAEWLRFCHALEVAVATARRVLNPKVEAVVDAAWEDGYSISDVEARRWLDAGWES